MGCSNFSDSEKRLSKLEYPAWYALPHLIGRIQLRDIKSYQFYNLCTITELSFTLFANLVNMIR
jgi:hypothetical protein